MRDINDLKARQSLPLAAKIALSQRRIKEWHDHFEGQVYVSVSDGKDSTVLLDLVRNTPGVYDVPAVFCDTGLEYPEVRDLARKLADVVLRPKMNFKQVIAHYGYPCVSKEQSQFIYEARHTRSQKLRKVRTDGKRRDSISSKWMYLLDAPFEIGHQCCEVMKKRPFHAYSKETGRQPILGVMACESSRRNTNYIKYGCNAYGKTTPQSTPMGFWTEQDVLEYIDVNGLEIPSVYGSIVKQGGGRSLTGVTRTGCMFCMFGVHMEQCPNRFQRMQKTHPKQWAYCMDQLGLREVLEYMHVPYEDNQMSIFDLEEEE